MNSTNLTLFSDGSKVPINKLNLQLPFIGENKQFPDKFEYDFEIEQTHKFMTVSFFVVVCWQVPRKPQMSDSLDNLSSVLNNHLKNTLLNYCTRTKLIVVNSE
jgi:hypothetical protein